MQLTPGRRYDPGLVAPRSWTWLLATAAGACVLGGIAAISSPIAAALVAVPLLLLLGFHRPTWGIGLWLVATIFTPSWTAVAAAGFTLYPVNVGLPIAAGMALHVLGRAHFRWPDQLLVWATLLASVLTTFYGTPFWLLVNLAGTLLLSYVFGRSAGEQLQRVYVWCMLLVAIWGLVEFAFDWHAFTGWFTSSGQTWYEVQGRSGVTRSEATIGHAIAYGACLVSALPFTRLLKHPLVAQIVLSLGVAVSFSRGPLIALALTLVLMVFTATSGRQRLVALAQLVAGGALVYFLFSFLYGGASADNEIRVSGNARSVQLGETIDRIRLFGPAEGAKVGTDGVLVTPGVEVIDSTPLRLAINFGWVYALLLLAPLAYGAFCVLRGRAGPATAALLGQAPVLLVTSLITQWQAMLFFVVGMAVAELAASREGPAPDHPKPMRSQAAPRVRARPAVSSP